MSLHIAPSEPQSLEIVTVTSTSMTLQWMPPKYPNGKITQYSVNCGGIDIDGFGDESGGKSNKMTDTIEALSPDTVYVLEMKAHTQVGPGPPVILPVKTCKLMSIIVCFVL